MQEKIKNAFEYINARRDAGDADEATIKNDASNIFADSFEEYMIIFEAVKNA